MSSNAYETVCTEKKTNASIMPFSTTEHPLHAVKDTIIPTVSLYSMCISGLLQMMFLAYYIWESWCPKRDLYQNSGLTDDSCGPGLISRRAYLFIICVLSLWCMISMLIGISYYGLKIRSHNISLYQS